MMKSFFTLFISCWLAGVSFAQSGKGMVTIPVQNEQQAPLEGATVELLRSQDSVLVKTAVSDKSGIALIENVAPASYFFRVSSVGFTTAYSKAFV
ncbi:MAG TPA: carboxypeptidase-like regulatory domain-containing protein, partial [Flavisolibacter sp.]